MAVKDVTVSFKADTKGLDQGSRAVNKLNKEVRKLPESVDALEKELKELELQLRKSTDPRDIKRLGTAIRDQKAVIKDVSREVNRLAGNTQRSFSKLNSGLLKIGATLGVSFGVSKLIGFTKELTNTAIQMEAFERRATTVFGKSIDIVRKFGEENARSLGLTQSQFLGATAAAGDLLVPLEFTRERAAQMSVELIKLGGALKQFTGDQRSANEISQAVSKSLTGEVEALKPLGIQIRLEDKSFRELVKTKIEDEGVTERQARALAIYQLSLEQSADALKSFEEDTDSLTRKQAELTASLKEVEETLATALVPAINDFFNEVLLTGSAIEFLTDKVKGLGSEQDEAGDRTESFFEKLEKGSKILGGVLSPFRTLIKFTRNFLAAQKQAANQQEENNEEVDKGNKKTVQQIRNIAFLQAKIKELTEERKRGTTTIARIRQINKEIIPLQKELNALLGKTKEERKKLTEAEKLEIEAEKELIKLAEEQRKAKEQEMKDIGDLLAFRDEQAIKEAQTIDEREQKEIEAARNRESRRLAETENEAQRILIKEETEADITEIEKKNQDERLENEQLVAEKLQELRIGVFDSAVGLTSALIGLTGQSAEAQAAVLLFEKLAAITSIIINTAKGNALLTAQLGIVAPAAIALNNVRAALSIATVGATAIPQFTAIKPTTVARPAGFAKGTADAPGGMAMVGEQGQEFMYVPQHTKILPNDKTTKYGEAISAMMTNKFDDFVVKDYIPSMILKPEVFNKSVMKSEKFDDKKLRRVGEDGNTILLGVHGQLAYLNKNIGNIKFRQRRGI